MRFPIRLLIVIFLAAATSLQAITYIVPTDRDLVKRAEAIVIATAVESHSEIRDGGRIVTVATLSVERVIKGLVTGESVQLVEMGGAVGDRAMMIPGSPRYESGKRYLVFMRTNKFGERVTYGFGLGKFEFTSDVTGRQLLTRGATNDEMFGFEESDWSSHVERLRAAAEFVNFVEAVAKADGPAREDYLLDRSSVVLAKFPEFGPHPTGFIPIAESTRPDYMLAGNYRWPAPSATFVYCCSPTFEPGFPSAPNDATSAMANWNGAGAGVNYTLSAVDNTANKGFTASDCKNAILFNDPNNEISGAAAIGGISTTGTTCTPPPGQPSGPFSYSLPDGNTYSKTLEVDVVVGKTINTNETTFIGVLTHELGHTLGFRHADGTSDPLSPQNGHPCVAPSPCAAIGSAIMASTIAFNLSTLQQWDLDAVQTVYGSGPVCTPPSIATQPNGVTITAGQSTTLSVGATGTSPTYQWYIGTAPSTSNPAPNGTTNQLTVSPGTTTNYWVRVSGCSTSVDSRTVTVTVNCAPPSVPAPLASPSSISSGQSSILSASPSGSGPFTYQWYVGSSGVTTNPIAGATSSSTTVSPTTTTSYWVRVTGQCAPFADSPAATVTVAACVPPTVPTPIASPSSISSGQSSTLTASPSGSGPFTYQWYTGNSGDTSSPIGGAINSQTTVSPSLTTNFWVKVTGQCGTFNSPATTVTVACTPIAPGGVTAQPSTINVGQSSAISVATSGSGPFTFQWFRGSLGDASNPIAGATGFNTLVSPTTSTSYWVRVTAPCGSQDGGVTVFVNAPCTPSSITTHPAFTTIAPGGSATLTVVAAGTAPISYQWYTGTSGNTGSPIAGATNASITVSPTVTTSYWVRVSNSCNTIGNNSTTALVTVSANCSAATITTQPASVSAPIGTVATLKVVATVTGTTIHYQWYKGAKGDLSTKVGTDSDTFTTGPVSVTASYWVRLTSACSDLTFTDSNAAIVTATRPPKGRAVRH